MVGEEGKKPDHPEAPPPAKKAVSLLKVFQFLLLAAGLGLAAWLGYRGYLRVEAWLSGFGTGAFWILGLIAGFVYYYAAHRIYERIREKPGGSGKAASYLFFCLALLVVNPIPLSLALWLYASSEKWAVTGHWFFIGCAVGAGIVLVLERLFARKKPKP